ncbi:MAG: formate dehydrogenase accessory sulfurtransferase FdhD, partial [Bacteroidales bacterium]
MPQFALMRPSAVVEWQSGRTDRRVDDLAGEEPLELVVNGRTLAVMMRTPGADRELAVGFLMSEGVISTARDLVAVEPGRSSDPAARNSVDV